LKIPPQAGERGTKGERSIKDKNHGGEVLKVFVAVHMGEIEVLDFKE
jgi:hypothetical protein